MISCRLCGGSTRRLFSKTVLGKYEVGFHECDVCESLQTDNPFWLDESYADGLRELDTGAVARAQALQRVTYLVAKLHGISADAKILDWGAGDGLMVRMLRDVGFDAYHWDLYARNTYAVGFDGGQDAHYDFITAFEVWEHLPNPASELDAIFSKQPEMHLATTSLYARQGEAWPYLNTLTGRHVFFYSRKAIQIIADKYGYSAEVFHNDLLMFSRRPPLNRFLAWIERRLLVSRRSKLLAVLFALKTKYGREREDQKIMVGRLRDKFKKLAEK